MAEYLHTLTFADGSSEDAFLCYLEDQSTLDVAFVDRDYSEVSAVMGDKEKTKVISADGHEYRNYTGIRNVMINNQYQDALVGDGYHVLVTFTMYFIPEYEADKAAMEAEIAELKSQAEDVKASVAEIQDEVFYMIDWDSASVDECRQQKKYDVSKVCEGSVDDGIAFDAGYGKEYFTYDILDQINYMNLDKMIRDNGLSEIPFHSSSRGGVTQAYRIYSAEKFQELYAKQEQNKISLITKCNAIYRWLDTVEDKDEMAKISFVSELPEEYKAEWEDTVAKSQKG